MGKVADLSNHVMVSVGDFYKEPRAADGFRDNMYSCSAGRHPT